MTDMMALILTGNASDRLHELTSMRSVSAVPFCARYRIIDFMLSSVVSSGIRNVGVITQKNYHSLMDHLGSGKAWDLHGKRNGLTILPPFVTPDNEGVYHGTLDAIRSNLHHLRRSTERYVLVADAALLYSAPFEDMLQQHIDTGADVTLMYADDPKLVQSGGKGRYLKIGEDGRVLNMEINPMLPVYTKRDLGALIIRRERLIELADRAQARGQHHFGEDVMLPGIRENRLKIYGWKNPGRAWLMENVQDYYNCSMEMLNPEIRRELFPRNRPVWTRVRDAVPTRYMESAQVKNSLIADGCVIEGTVENSILFRDVQVKAGAVIKNAIIMQGGYIMENAHVEGCILDKNVMVRPGSTMITPPSYPVVISKGSIV